MQPFSLRHDRQAVAAAAGLTLNVRDSREISIAIF